MEQMRGHGLPHRRSHMQLLHRVESGDSGSCVHGVCVDGGNALRLPVLPRKNVSSVLLVKFRGRST